MKVNRKLLLLPLALVLLLSACGESENLEEKTSRVLDEKINGLEEEESYLDEEPPEQEQENKDPQQEKPLSRVILTRMTQLNHAMYEEYGINLGVLEFDIVDDIPVFTFIPGDEFAAEMIYILDNLPEEIDGSEIFDITFQDYGRDYLLVSEDISEVMHEPSILQIADPNNLHEPMFIAYNGKLLYDPYEITYFYFEEGNENSRY